MNLSYLTRFPERLVAPLCATVPTTTTTRGNRAENFAIEGRDLKFSFATTTTTRQTQDVPVLKDCSIRIPCGQFWMLLGPNGCGKSTLLKVYYYQNSEVRVIVLQCNPEHSVQILAGLLTPTSGTVYVNGPKSFVFQNPDHQVVMPTVDSDVAFGLGKINLTNDEVRSRVSRALHAVGLSDYMKRSVQTLSGGQKQRVAIAGALAEACKILLLDELTTFLDETDQVGVIKAVRNSVDTSAEVTALWVTHRLEELEYADGAIYMEDGKVVMHGDAASIRSFIEARQAAYITQINT